MKSISTFHLTFLTLLLAYQFIGCKSQVQPTVVEDSDIVISKDSIIEENSVVLSSVELVDTVNGALQIINIDPADIHAFFASDSINLDAKLPDVFVKRIDIEAGDFEFEDNSIEEFNDFPEDESAESFTKKTTYVAENYTWLSKTYTYCFWPFLCGKNVRFKSSVRVKLPDKAHIMGVRCYMADAEGKNVRKWHKCIRPYNGDRWCTERKDFGWCWIERIDQWVETDKKGNKVKIVSALFVNEKHDMNRAGRLVVRYTR